MKIEPLPEFKQEFAIMEKVIELGKDCKFCDFFWNHNPERLNYDQIRAHLYLSHREEALELNPRTVLEFL